MKKRAQLCREVHSRALEMAAIEKYPIGKMLAVVSAVECPLKQESNQTQRGGEGYNIRAKKKGWP